MFLSLLFSCRRGLLPFSIAWSFLCGQERFMQMCQRAQGKWPELPANTLHTKVVKLTDLYLYYSFLITTLTVFPPSVLQMAVCGEIFGAASSGLLGLRRKCERSWPVTMTTTATLAKGEQSRRYWWVQIIWVWGVYLILPNSSSEAPSDWMRSECYIIG